jgi:hypothetical protein
MGHLVKRNTSRIDNGQIIAEGLKEFHKANAVGHHHFGRHTKMNSGAFFMLFVLSSDIDGAASWNAH